MMVNTIACPHPFAAVSATMPRRLLAWTTPASPSSDVARNASRRRAWSFSSFTPRVSARKVFISSSVASRARRKCRVARLIGS
jgi:hypothetical protein